MNSFHERLKNKDEEAFEKLYDKYVKLVYHITYSYTRCKEDAEDLTIEVFTKVYNNLDKYEERQKLKEWISEIARNTALNFVTRNKMKDVIFDDEVVDSVHSYDSTHTELIDLFEKRLDNGTKQIMIMKFIYNYTFKEIAKVNNMTLGKVQGLYYDGIEKLRKELKNG